MGIPRILLVEDDRELLDLLGYALQRAGLVPIAAYDVPTAWNLLERERPHLIVLDINLGRWNGLEFLSTLRKRSDIPVILLTSLDAEDDRVRGLELGANDYLGKPFSYRELIARIRARLADRQRGKAQGAAAAAPTEVLRVGPLQLNAAEHAVYYHDERIHLSTTEFRILHYLMLNAGSVVPNATLARHVWGYHEEGHSDTIRVMMHRLRRKLERDAEQPRLLHTVPRVGVMLKA